MRRRLAALLSLAALGAAACGGAADTGSADLSFTGTAADEAPDGDAAAPADDTGDDTADDTGDDTPVADIPPPSAEAVAALDWQTIDTSEAAIDGTAFAGQDVLLWIWAPWCSICNREAPMIRPVLQDRGDDVVILGLAGKDSLDAHRGFVAEHDLGFMRHVVDQDNSIWTKYGVGYQPAFVFINQDGRVAVHAGAIGAEGLDAAIDQLVAA